MAHSVQFLTGAARDRKEKNRPLTGILLYISFTVLYRNFVVFNFAVGYCVFGQKSPEQIRRIDRNLFPE